MTRSASQTDDPHAPQRERTGETTTNLLGEHPFPDPHAVLALRDCEVFRAIDDDEDPVLIITDGTTTIALECGLVGLKFKVVQRMRLLADAMDDYVSSLERAYRASQDDPAEVSGAATRN